MLISVRYSVTIVRRTRDCTSSGPLLVIWDGLQVDWDCTQAANILF